MAETTTCFFAPPLRKPTGGTIVLFGMAEILHRAGFRVCMVPREDGPQLELPDVPVTPWSELRLAPDDVWLVPEGWVNALAPGLSAGARCVNYCQNWAYFFSALPDNVSWPQLPVHFLAVSQPVAWFMSQTTAADPPILRPGIDTGLFRPGDKGGRTIRIAWMPRKNKALAQQIREVFTARQGLEGFSDVEWVAIQGLARDQVAQELGRCHIFLATGFPEGCPLPPLEAMACGCLCVGFGGFGGWDYMRQARGAGSEARFAPWWPLRPGSETPWAETGNGLWCADADVTAAALALEEAVAWVREGDPRLAATLSGASLTAAAYSLEEHEKTLLELWERVADNSLFSRNA